MERLTQHARARMQQRGISTATLEALLDFGREIHVDRGRDLVLFDKLYAILGSDGTVITVGHRFRRIPRRG